MKRIMFRSPLRVAATATALGLVLIAMVAVSANANAWLRSTRQPPSTSITKNPGKAQPQPEATAIVSTRTATPQPAKDRIGSELISISRFGLETTEITRPAGKFFLIIENRSGLNPITLRLKSKHGEKVIEVTPPQDQLDWAEEMNLHPDRYTLTIAERPSWICDITITQP